MKLLKVLLLCSLAVAFLFMSCRRRQPSLVDRNQAPETELWYAPPESTEYEYKVHLYWRGVDRDGVVTRYIWAITDTVTQGEGRWDPANNLAHFRMGRITTRTDSTFSFTAFKSIGGGGLKKNRQAFHVASIDDNGVIDPTPAEVEFIATIEKLPEMRFTVVKPRMEPNAIGVWEVDGFDIVPFSAATIETVGMYRPFGISYHGVTKNGEVRAYRWFPLSGMHMPGAGEWTDVTSDTSRWFLNAYPDSLLPSGFPEFLASGFPDTIPSGIFRLAAQCRDDASAESEIDGARFTKGVCQVVVNFEPETVVDTVVSIFKSGGSWQTRQVNFADSEPDTVPFRSWLYLKFRGWDNPKDGTLCQDPNNKCIGYKLRYVVSSRIAGQLLYKSSLLPTRGLHDTDPCNVEDSTSLKIGTAEYKIEIISVDEEGKMDGTPAVVNIVGNYAPILDSFSLENYDGTAISDGDTLLWRWDDVPPIPVVDDTLFHWEKTFYFDIKASAHDHPWELENSGVKTWLYQMTSFTDPRINKEFARSGGWVRTVEVNVLNDRFQATFVYPWWDESASTIFNDPPNWIGVERADTNYAVGYTYSVRGRDTDLSEQFSEFIHLRNPYLDPALFQCPLDPRVQVAEKVLQNELFVGSLGRMTGWGRMDFYLKLVR